MTRLTFLFAAAAAILRGQSSITVQQLRRGSRDPDQLIAVDPRGQFYALKLGAGMAIIDGEIRAELATPQRLTGAADGTYPVVPRVAWNGLVQTPGADYTIANGRIVPVKVWAADDIVTAF